MGGITSGRDVLDYILVGAAAVQIGTVNFSEPAAAVRIVGEIEAEMDRLAHRGPFRDPGQAAGLSSVFSSACPSG